MMVTKTQAASAGAMGVRSERPASDIAANWASSLRCASICSGRDKSTEWSGYVRNCSFTQPRSGCNVIASCVLR